ncbi:MAG: CRISPR system precrRNA processing endoribonuclease RAMP protein Cas6 [Deltaproteobacteria bacterium]|nr:CRISPR system precrRNA processing endoribonuclease RAMP protein Cas6 [Deltaproteobacteria bacterium]
MPLFYEDLKKSFVSFQCLCLSISAKVTDQIIIPGYQGGALRGAFGKALKKIACPEKSPEEKQVCKNCILSSRCAYSYVFETPPPNDAEMLKKYPFIPHPYILNPAINSLNTYNRGDVFNFGITLVGRAVDYLPFIIYAFIRMGETGNGNGIGKLKKEQGKKPQRGGFQINKIHTLNAAGEESGAIYDNQILQQTDKTLCFDDAGLISSRYSSDQISLNFLTPLRIRYKNRLCDDPQFHILIRNLLRRLSSLNYFHCNQKLELPFKEIIEKAERIELVYNQTKWHDWSRYSGRQKKSMKLGGITGMATYKGNLADFMPLLVLGSWVNIGKQTGFGLGRYGLIF